jgi:hypothetical protein
LEILLAFFGGQRSWNHMRRVAQPDALVSEHVIVDLEMQFGPLTGGDFSEINLIAVLGLAFLFQRQVCFGGDDSDFLMRFGILAMPRDFRDVSVALASIVSPPVTGVRQWSINRCFEKPLISGLPGL